MSPLNPTGARTSDVDEDRTPVFPPIPSDDYEPLNAHITEGDWPDLSDPDEAPLWTLTNEPLTTDSYEWKRERNGSKS